MTHNSNPHYLCNYEIVFGYLGMSHGPVVGHKYTPWTTAISSLFMRSASYVSNTCICFVMALSFAGFPLAELQFTLKASGELEPPPVRCIAWDHWYSILFFFTHYDYDERVDFLPVVKLSINTNISSLLDKLSTLLLPRNLIKYGVSCCTFLLGY